jgi:hypothetical protein
MIEQWVVKHVDFYTVCKISKVMGAFGLVPNFYLISLPLIEIFTWPSWAQSEGPLRDLSLRMAIVNVSDNDCVVKFSPQNSTNRFFQLSLLLNTSSREIGRRAGGTTLATPDEFIDEQVDFFD